MVARHPALKAYDVFLGSFRPIELFQILVDAGEQVRVVPLEGTGRVQHILDDLLHPPAVRLVRESFLRPLDDGGDLFQYLSCTSSGETTFMSTFLSLTLKQMFEASEEDFFR